MHTVARPGSGRPFRVASPVGVDLRDRCFGVEASWFRQHVLDAQFHLLAGRPSEEIFRYDAATPHGSRFGCWCPLRRVLLFCRGVIQAEDSSGGWVRFMPDPFAVVVEVVRVREGLVAVRAVMVAAVLEVALPGGVGSVREDGSDAPMLPRGLGQLEEPEGLLDVCSMSDVHKVVPVSQACLSPCTVSGGLEDEVREVVHLGDVPGAVREPPCRGRERFDVELAEELEDVVNWPFRRPVVGRELLPVVRNLLREVPIV